MIYGIGLGLTQTRKDAEVMATEKTKSHENGWRWSNLTVEVE